MDSNDQITHILGKFRSWFEEAITIIQEVKPEERLPVTVLSERVAAKFNMKGSQMYPILRFLFDYISLPGIKRQKGAHGGFIRISNKEQETQKS